MKPLLPTALACGLAWIAGCGGGVDAGLAAAGTDGAPRTAITGPAAPSVNLVQVLRRMHRAPMNVAHSGVRRVEQHWLVEDHPSELVYREKIAFDGQGQFAIEAYELIGASLAPNEEALFIALQSARAGFVRRYRDFAVRDVEAFLRNYSMVDTGALVTVAGRPCDEYLVQRVVDHAVRYWIAVDRETSLVLRTRHETAAGDLLGLVEFESLDLNPTFQGVTWRQPITDETPLASDKSEALAQLGFEPRLPNTDGGRFVLQSATAVVAPHPWGGAPQTWAKHALTDGVEVVFLLHGGADPRPGPDDVVRVAPSVGPWNTAEGSLRGQLFTAMGRVSVRELLDLLETTL